MYQIGGATGRVGDPSGRLVERRMADAKQVEDNVVNLTSSIQAFFERAYLYAGSRLSLDSCVMSAPVVRSNLDWHESFTLLDFLQTVGVHARVNTMLNRERCVGMG
jgi:tyrosyl-tRNA synthetase